MYALENKMQRMFIAELIRLANENQDRKIEYYFNGLSLAESFKMYKTLEMLCYRIYDKSMFDMLGHKAYQIYQPLINDLRNNQSEYNRTAYDIQLAYLFKMVLDNSNSFDQNKNLEYYLNY